MLKKLLLFFVLTVIALSKNSLHAQLCQGSLGDPVGDFTFGAGGNPGPQLYGITNYAYVNTDCPEDGSYTLRNQTSNCFGGSWHSLAHDHTGNPNGYFMLVNVSYMPGDYFVTPVRGLCQGTIYEFAAWVLNMDVPGPECGGVIILPNIIFSIETASQQVIKSFRTGEIPTSNPATWQQYGFYFETAAGDSTFGTYYYLIDLKNGLPKMSGWVEVLY